MTLPVFITVIADHDKPQPSGCLLDQPHVLNVQRRDLAVHVRQHRALRQLPAAILVTLMLSRLVQPPD